jgi:hypothetical protein
MLVMLNLTASMAMEAPLMMRLAVCTLLQD